MKDIDFVFSCPLCEQSAVDLLVSFDDFSVGHCKDCGAAMILTVKGCEAEYYSERYEGEILASKARTCWNLLETKTDGLREVRSILDIGCGRGTFLDIARDNDLQTAGIELASDAASYARSKGHQVLCGSATEVTFSDGVYFEVVTLWDLLEHFDNPRQALLHSYDVLAPAGQLFILTPMKGSIYDRLGLLLLRLSGGRVATLVRMCWSSEHLFRFDAHGLEEVLLSIGFQEVSVQPVLLLSLMPDRYAGGVILPSWTGLRAVDRLISQVGVWTAEKLHFHNKILIKAIKGVA